MTDTGFRPADSLRTRIAPTEVNSPRGYSLQGEVHDENAYALGGVAGHAGLFSTAADLAVFAQMMLNGGEYDGTRIIADSTVALFTTRAAGTRALGWDTCGGSGSCGKYFGEEAYGHTGFTGTSLWIDPDSRHVRHPAHQPRARRARQAPGEGDLRRSRRSRRRRRARRDRLRRRADGMPAKFRADQAVDWQKPVRRPRKHTSTKKRSPSSSSSASRSSGSKASASKSKAPASKPSASKAPAKKKSSS